MSEMNFDLIEATLRATHSPDFGWKLLSFDELPSTNGYSKEHCGEFEGPTIVATRHQTAGRGRGDHTWEDDPNSAFLSTWTLELKDVEPDPRWTLGLGLYLFESLSEAFRSVRFSMKAPNDICIGDKKVAGVLVEATSQGDTHFLHVGVGINVFSYPTQHSAVATHLNAFLGTSQLTPESWGEFIEYFGSSLINLERKVGSQKDWLSRLSNRLIAALNRHPSTTGNLVVGVRGDGTLLKERGEVQWQEL